MVIAFNHNLGNCKLCKLICRPTGHQPFIGHQHKQTWSSKTKGRFHCAWARVPKREAFRELNCAKHDASLCVCIRNMSTRLGVTRHACIIVITHPKDSWSQGPDWAAILLACRSSCMEWCADKEGGSGHNLEPWLHRLHEQLASVVANEIFSPSPFNHFSIYLRYNGGRVS